MKLVLFCGIVCSLGLSVSGKPLDDSRFSDVELYRDQFRHPSVVETKSRRRRSLTAFLAAEVLILERILAAQNARKARKISRPAIHTNKINNNVEFRSKPTLIKPLQPSPVKIFKFPAPAAPLVTSPPSTVSSLDPFVMLKAPDLSKNSYGEYELYQTVRSSSPSLSSLSSIASVSSSSHHSVPDIFADQDTLSVRQPKKRKLHYGAFELYQL